LSNTLNAKNKKLAVIYMLLSALVFAIMAGLVKKSGDLPSMEKAMFRNLVSLFISIAILKTKRMSLWGQKKNRAVLLLRGAVGTIGLICYFYSIDHLILADSSMLNRLSPFFVMLFAIIILKNRINRYQILSLIIALAGSALIIKPGFHISGTFPAVIGFLSAVFSGLAYTLVSFLGKRENSYTIVFYFSLVSSIVCLPMSLLNPVVPDLTQLLLLLAAGIMAAMGQFLLTGAYRYAPAAEVSIYNYSNIIFASLLGIFFFAEFPDIFSILGYLMIFGAGYLVFIKGR